MNVRYTAYDSTLLLFQHTCTVNQTIIYCYQWKNANQSFLYVLLSTPVLRFSTDFSWNRHCWIQIIKIQRTASFFHFWKTEKNLLTDLKYRTFTQRTTNAKKIQLERPVVFKYYIARSKLLCKCLHCMRWSTWIRYMITAP